MGHLQDSFYTMTGIHHSTISTHGCPHCCLDLHPEHGPLPHHLGEFQSYYI